MSTVYGYAVVDLSNRPFSASSGKSLFPTDQTTAVDRLLRDVTGNKFSARIVALVARKDDEKLAGYAVVDGGERPRIELFAPSQKVKAEKVSGFRRFQGYATSRVELTFKVIEAKK